jgi:hypothetical protein
MMVLIYSSGLIGTTTWGQISSPIL